MTTNVHGQGALPLNGLLLDLFLRQLQDPRKQIVLKMLFNLSVLLGFSRTGCARHGGSMLLCALSRVQRLGDQNVISGGYMADRAVSEPSHFSC